MKIEIEHEGSCLGATGGTGRLIVRDALAKGHSVVVLVRAIFRATAPSRCRSAMRLTPDQRREAVAMLNQKPILALTVRLPPNAEVARLLVTF
jgi:uncharacterized protein YbjT (DUF2867 family)